MIDVVAQKDLSDPTMQTIADRAGVSVGSVYQYFPTKGALVSGLLRYHLKLRMSELEVQLRSARDLEPKDAARALVEGLVSGMRTQSKFELAMVRYFTRAGDIATLTELDEQMCGHVRAFLAALGDRIRPVNLDIAAFVVSNALRSAVLLTVAQKPDRLSDPAFTAELTYLVERYLERVEPR